MSKVSRRTLLRGLVGAGALVTLAACTKSTSLIGPSAIASAESERPRSGAIRKLSLTAAPTTIDLAGRQVQTWAYGTSPIAAGLRATVGDRVQIAFSNKLPEATSVHWHGLAIRNDMDGVPGVTTPAIASGGNFLYDFTIPNSGTHWFHPHTGLQLDRGLFAPFIIDDPNEPGKYDSEWILVLDDWTDGVGPSPEDIFAKLKAGGGTNTGGMSGMAGMSGMGSGGALDGGDVTYPFFLINGRPAEDPDVLQARPGQKIRLRIINAAADTIFQVALADHEMLVTQTDGYPVQPIRTSLLRIGMGERYDAIVTLKDGAFSFVAMPVGKSGSARAVVRTGSGSLPAIDSLPVESRFTPLTVADLSAGIGSALPRSSPDMTQVIHLAGSMQPYTWTINGRTYDKTEPVQIKQGQYGRLRIQNASMMSHPIHLHGHTFQIGAAGGRGPRKDTVLVPPMGSVSVDFKANNPGRWMLHCHNAYHAEAGMMTRLEYVV
jgi:FtsP/CotA-like multicopper oxidase with cupredoxin domain